MEQETSAVEAVETEEVVAAAVTGVDGARLTVVEAEGLEAVTEERDRLKAELEGLERRYATEQSANKALLATLKELEGRQALRAQRLRAVECQLRVATSQNDELSAELEHATRPLWRKLLRRS